jgi:hypothetical protein
MTEALVQINDQLAQAARASGFDAAVFHCECGDCLAEDVGLSLEEHDEIRAREDLIFAPEHNAPTGRAKRADSARQGRAVARHQIVLNCSNGWRQLSQ